MAPRHGAAPFGTLYEAEVRTAKSSLGIARLSQGASQGVHKVQNKGFTRGAARGEFVEKTVSNNRVSL